jgi:hypothetical protein
MNKVKWVSLYSRKLEMMGGETKNDRKKPLESTMSKES